MLREFQDFSDAGKGEPGGGGSGFNGLVGFFKIVPRDSLDVGADDQVGVPLPGIELMLLRGADGAGNHLEHIFRSARVLVMNADRDSDDDVRAELTRSLGGDGSDKTAVGKPASADLDWFEQAGESATGANGVHERALAENDWITGRQIGGDDRKRDFHVFELLGVEDAFDEISKAMIAGQAEARNTPAGEIPKTNGAAGSENAGQWSATGIGGSEDAADTGAGDVRDRDVILLQDLEHAQVREAAGKSTAKSQRYAGPWGLGDFSAVGGEFHDAGSFAAVVAPDQWATRSENVVPMYIFQKRIKNDALTQNSTEGLLEYPRCTIGACTPKPHSHSRRNEVL